MKPALKSSTIWVNLALAVAVKFFPWLRENLCGNPELTIQLVALMNILLRKKTKEGISSSYNWIFVLLCFGLLLSGCTSLIVPNLMDTQKAYPYDLEMVIDGVEYRGVAVLDDKSSYEIKFIGKGSMAFFMIANCHATIRSSDINGDGWFLWKKRPAFPWTYEPNKIEREAVCPIEISALDKSGGRHAFGYIEFRRPEFKLSANLICSRKTTRERGVSVCNESDALEQEISFDTEVVVDVPNGCSPMVAVSPNTYRYRMPPSKCQYGFMDLNMNTHRHVALGFSGVIHTEVEEKK